MDEKIIIKSERFNVKKVAAIIVIIGFALLIAYAVFDTIKYSDNFNELAAKNYDWFDYSSPLDMALKQDGGFIVAFLLPVVFAIIAFIVYRAYSKIELTVTDKRVFGCATFGKRVDLPLDAISAVGTSSMKGIDVTTASGENGISITADASGIGGQISGLNISITDSKGNVKKSANAALDAFSETIRAQNKSEDNAISLQVGASANQSIKVGLTDMRAEALGLKGADGTTLNISTQGKANAAINVLDNAIAKALDQQTTIGSVESRLEYTSSNLTTASENVQASESTIRDADMAKEMTNYTKNNVLLQAAQSMLAQANQSSSNVLSLLQ